jgi:DNA-directed RNA polymerase specialized sigma24 family protein
MSSGGSVTFWLEQLKAGNDAAVRPLWERYFTRLVGLARAHLHGGPRGAADEEDVACRAFVSFCLRAQEGRFPNLEDRDDLWALLLRITSRKALKQCEHERRQKRGGGAVLNEAALADRSLPALDQVAAAEPEPDELRQPEPLGGGGDVPFRVPVFSAPFFSGPAFSLGVPSASTGTIAICPRRYPPSTFAYPPQRLVSRIAWKGN